MFNIYFMIEIALGELYKLFHVFCVLLQMNLASRQWNHISLTQLTQSNMFLFTNFSVVLLEIRHGSPLWDKIVAKEEEVTKWCLSRTCALRSSFIIFRSIKVNCSKTDNWYHGYMLIPCVRNSSVDAITNCAHRLKKC